MKKSVGFFMTILSAAAAAVGAAMWSTYTTGANI